MWHPDYVLVHEDDREALLAELRRQAALAYPDPAANPDYTAIINQAHFDRLQRWRDEAAQLGARVEVLAAGSSEAALNAARKLPLTLIENAPAHSYGDARGNLRPAVAHHHLRQNRQCGGLYQCPRQAAGTVPVRR